jgi:hypothetical protein
MASAIQELDTGDPREQLPVSAPPTAHQHRWGESPQPHSPHPSGLGPQSLLGQPDEDLGPIGCGTTGVVLVVLKPQIALILLIQELLS